MKVNPEIDRITINGQPVKYREYIYLMLNKPLGVVSATRDRDQKVVTDLLDKEYQKFSLFPAGRLDKNTEGLILLTNDGDLSHRLLAPKNEVAKLYEAKIQGRVTEEDVEKFQKGIELKDGYITKAAKLEIITSNDISDVKITIVEGKYHQIRRMFAALGKKVLELKRLQLGPLILDPLLKQGEYRELTEKEIKHLKEY